MTDRREEAAFEAVADKELNRLVDAIIDCSEEVDPDLASGVLTILFEDASKFVVNSHRAARQIWMAADRSAWHFDYQPAQGRWIAQPSGDELWTALSQVLSRKLGCTIKLVA